MDNITGDEGLKAQAGFAHDVAKFLPVTKRFGRFFGIACIAVGAFILRSIFLGKQSLWTDEAFSIWVSNHSLPTLLQILKLDAHPPFFYAWLHFWMTLGTGEAWLRLPSVFLGTLNCILIYFLGKFLLNEKIGFLGALFWACSFVALNQETQVRMYAYATAFSLSASLFFWLAYTRRSFHYWLFYIVFGLLSLYTHYFTAFILIAHLGFLLAKREWKSVFFCAALFTFGFSFCLPLFLTQLYAGGGKLIPLISSTEYVMNLGWMLIAYRFFSAPLYYIAATLIGMFLVALSVVPIKRLQDGKFFLILLFIVPFFLPFLFTKLFSLHLLAFRYLTVLAPYYYLLIVSALLKLPRPVGLPVFAALIVINLAVWFLLLTGPAYQRQNWKEAAKIIHRSVRHGDAFFIEEAPAVFPLCYYLPDLVAVGWMNGSYRIQSQVPDIPWVIVEGEKSLPTVQAISNQTKRQWLVWFLGYYPDPKGKVNHFLEREKMQRAVYYLRSFDPDNEIYLYRFQ